MLLRYKMVLLRFVDQDVLNVLVLAVYQDMSMTLLCLFVRNVLQDVLFVHLPTLHNAQLALQALTLPQLPDVYLVPVIV